MNDADDIVEEHNALIARDTRQMPASQGKSNPMIVVAVIVVIILVVTIVSSRRI